VADLTDFETAEAIRDEKLPSPTKYGDFYLFDLRVTGTGHAYRDSLDEWAIRDPKLWLHDDFVKRVNGLPVIFEHPERSGLNSDEFKERAIGTVILPYVKGDEVWGIAKIFDADAAELMQTTHVSTSPGVTPPQGSEATELKDGTKVLAEGLPLILDHLAVCEAGVWDKDGPPEGVRLDRKGSVVTEEEKKALEKERDDAKIRADAAESELKEVKADKARRDAEEKELEDKRRKDAEESDKEELAAMEKEKADKKKDSRKSRHDKHDGDIMDCAKCDSEEKEEADKAKKDAAAKEEIDANEGTKEIHDSKALREELEATNKRFSEMASQLAALSRPPSIEDTDAIAKSFHRADALFQMLGEKTPTAMPGEKPIAYRRRLANRLRPFTDSWKNYAFHDAQHAQDFDLVERAIYAEAEAHVNKTVEDRPGFLQELVDRHSIPGKVKTTFRGDSRAAWLPFMPPVQRYIVGFNRNPNSSAPR
jgi:hypothetical protein